RIFDHPAGVARRERYIRDDSVQGIGWIELAEGLPLDFLEAADTTERSAAKGDRWSLIESESRDHRRNIAREMGVCKPPIVDVNDHTLRGEACRSKEHKLSGTGNSPVWQVDRCPADILRRDVAGGSYASIRRR